MKSWDYSDEQQSIILTTYDHKIKSQIWLMVKEYEEDGDIDDLQNPLPDWIIEYIEEITDEARTHFIRSRK